MCGIAGSFNYSGTKEQLEALGGAMLETLEHRGPDAQGIWTAAEYGLVLGHRRLSIQDLSEHGAQPMHSTSQRYCVIFNGEIYNFMELASELKQAGHMFNGHSDTEVLLAAIEEWGLVPATKRFVGMFAFALWDNQEKTLSLCRDRLGEKPLYYGAIGKSLYFSSELKAIERAVDRSKLTLNFTALNCFLRYGYINAPHSIYEGFFKLLPGTILTLNISDINNSSLPSPLAYWSIFDAANNNIGSRLETEGEAIEQLDALLRGTVSRQLIADVNVGTFLSGGIDSTLVSAIAQDISPHKIKTFTIGFQEKEYDESPYAKEIAKHIASDHQEVYVTSGDALRVIPDLPKIYDEPFADSSQIPTFLVSKIAKQQVTVCLSGDGGDELFSGYNRYMWLAHIWDKVKVIPRPLRALAASILATPSPQLWRKLYSVVSRASNTKKGHSLLEIKIQKIAGLLPNTNIHDSYDYLLSYWNTPESILSSEYSRAYSNKPESFPHALEFMEQAMYWDQTSYLPGDNLAKVDRASMRVSLETRLPLLSHEIVEYSWRLPLAMKVKKNTGKWILRSVLDRYVPEHLLDRPKMGFSVPMSTWLRNDLKEWAEDLLFGNRMNGDAIFNNNQLHKMWDAHITGQRDHSHQFWVILMFLAWQYERFS